MIRLILRCFRRAATETREWVRNLGVKLGSTPTDVPHGDHICPSRMQHFERFLQFLVIFINIWSSEHAETELNDTNLMRGIEFREICIYLNELLPGF